MVDTIGRGEFSAMLRSGAEEARSNHEELSRLDAATGDGDHGTSMKRAMDKTGEAKLFSANISIRRWLGQRQVVDFFAFFTGKKV